MNFFLKFRLYLWKAIICSNIILMNYHHLRYIINERRLSLQMNKILLNCLLHKNEEYLLEKMFSNN